MSVVLVARTYETHVGRQCVARRKFGTQKCSTGVRNGRRVLWGCLFHELMESDSGISINSPGGTTMTHNILRVVSVFLPAVLFCSFGCQPVASSLVGAAGDTQIPNTTLTIDTTYISYGLLYAKGKVYNNGTAQITPPWYVECQFYTDSTFTIKLGGNYTEIYVPLDPGQATFWTVSFSSTNVAVQNYPHFKVKDQRAIYKKTS